MYVPFSILVHVTAAFFRRNKKMQETDALACGIIIVPAWLTQTVRHAGESGFM
jgi:hypothetical protein